MLHSALVANVVGPELTRANSAVGTAYTNADFERAIRRGLRPSGHAPAVDALLDYVSMSDDDVASVIAYIRSAKPVERPYRRSGSGPSAA